MNAFLRGLVSDIVDCCCGSGGSGEKRMRRKNGVSAWCGG